MKVFHYLSAFAAFASATLFGGSVAVTNEILTVDQNNVPSVTNVLGTVSDVAKLEAQTEINAASAAATEVVYEEVTNVLDAVARELTAERAVVYRCYFLDSFTAAVLVDPTVDKVRIYGWGPLDTQDTAGRVKYYMYFGTTFELQSLTPQVKSYNSLTNGVAGFEFLADQYVSNPPTPMSGTWTDADGNVYSYLYRVTVSLPDEQSHFCIVYIDTSSAGGSGDTLTIVGGVSGGETKTVDAGDLRMEITGGLCTCASNIVVNAQ